MHGSLDTTSPLLLRLLAWAKERFPAANGVFCLVLYAAALSLGRSSAKAGAIAIGLGDVFGFFASYAFLLMLRVYDEHKDYELDCQNHPQRVLQRGLITLTHLKVLGGIAIVLQIGVSLYLDRGVGAITYRWLPVFVYSALMAKEFFIGEWLSKHLVLYALSHMVVLPMSVLWMIQMGAQDGSLTSAAYLLCTISLVSGFSFEVGRKTWAPEEERATVDSYSKSLGLRGAVITLLVLSLAMAALLFVMAKDGPVGLYGALAASAFCIATTVPILRFYKNPTNKGFKINQAVLGLQSVVAYTLCIVTYLVPRGVLWR